MKQNTLKIILIIFIACTLIGSILFFVQAGRHAQTQNEILNTSHHQAVATFESANATLTLFKDDEASSVEDNTQQWIARLRMHMPNCKGGLGISPETDPPVAKLQAGNLSNGQIIIHQAPTIGEPSCEVSLMIKNGTIIQSDETKGSCGVWHGPKCHFDTETLNLMKAQE